YCLKKDAMNIDPDQKTTPFVQLVYNHGTSAIGSGLQYFGNGSLLFSSSDPDTVTFFVGLGGPNVNKDVTLKVGVDNNSLQDNQSNDGLTYVAMPTDDYKI